MHGHAIGHRRTSHRVGAGICKNLIECGQVKGLTLCLRPAQIHQAPEALATAVRAARPGRPALVAGAGGAGTLAMCILRRSPAL